MRDDCTDSRSRVEPRRLLAASNKNGKGKRPKTLIRAEPIRAEPEQQLSNFNGLDKSHGIGVRLPERKTYVETRTRDCHAKTRFLLLTSSRISVKYINST